MVTPGRHPRLLFELRSWHRRYAVDKTRKVLLAVFGPRRRYRWYDIEAVAF